MPAAKRKRGDTGVPYGKYDASAEAKRQRLASAQEQQFLIRGGFNPRAPAVAKMYVERTPGGNVVSNVHYYDATRPTIAILATDSTWAGGELDATSGAVGAEVALNCLFAPIQGDDIANRQGRKAFVKKIRITGTMIMPTQTAQTTLDTPAKVRLILYCDKQSNGTQSQAEEVIQSGSDTSPLNMFQNTATFGRFKIYKDKTYTFSPIQGVNDTGATGGVVQGAQKKHFKLTANINMWVNYKSTNGGTVADVTDNAFHLIGATDGVTTAPTIHYKVRTSFLP